MLILTRKPGEKVVTSNGISVTLTEVNNKVRLAFAAPDDVRILRAELANLPKQRRHIDGLEVSKHDRLADQEPPTYSSEWLLTGRDRTPAEARTTSTPQP